VGVELEQAMELLKHLDWMVPLLWRDHGESKDIAMASKCNRPISREMNTEEMKINCTHYMSMF
jgi:hypothetical protein